MTIAKKNVILFTSQDIGYQLVELLAKRSDISVLVVTQRTKRDELNGYRFAGDACVAHDIPHLVTGRIDETVKARIQAHNPDLMVSAYYPVKIPPEVIRLSKGSAVNIHPGTLPFYRGRYPTPWYILNGATEFGLCIHELDKGIDTGKVYFQKAFPIHPDDTGAKLYRRTMDEGARMIAEHFDELLLGTVRGTEQFGQGSYYTTIEKRYHIDWNQAREQIIRRIRVHAPPYFPAYAFLFNKMLLISRAQAIDVPGYTAQGGGTIIEVLPDGRFVVSCSDGCICVEDFSVAPSFKDGEREMHIQSGNQLE